MVYNECSILEDIFLAVLLNMTKLTNRPGFYRTVPVWDILSQNPERCLRDAKMPRFSFRSPGQDRTQSK